MVVDVRAPSRKKENDVHGQCREGRFPEYVTLCRQIEIFSPHIYVYLQRRGFQKLVFSFRQCSEGKQKTIGRSSRSETEHTRMTKRQRAQ